MTTSLPRVALLGLGRAGRALAREFRAHDVPVVLQWNRSHTHAPLADAPLACGPLPPTEALASADVLLLAVRDEAIAELADALPVLPGVVRLHLSGVLPGDALPRRAGDGPRGGYHPLQALAPTAAPALPVPPYGVAVDGDADAIALAWRLAAATGHACVHVPAEHRAAYHAAAVLAANALVALEATADRVLARTGLQPEARWALLWPLAVGSLANLGRGPRAEALTGPVARGDAATVARHLRELADDPGAAAAYRALTEEALSLVEERLNPADAAALAAALTTGKDPAL